MTSHSVRSPGSLDIISQNIKVGRTSHESEGKIYPCHIRIISQSVLGSTPSHDTRLGVTAQGRAMHDISHLRNHNQTACPQQYSQSGCRSGRHCPGQVAIPWDKLISCTFNILTGVTAVLLKLF